MSGEIKLHSVWKESINDTLEIFDKIIYDPDGIVGFNLVFDWFHLVQMYTTLSLIPGSKWDDPPDIFEYAALEPEGRFGPCIKPVKACDLMLHARKGPYQSTMDRKDIRIRRVPTPLAWQLKDELEKRIPLKDIYFARKKDKKRWEVYDIEDARGRVNTDFKDIMLKFAPSSALKALAMDAFDIDDSDILRFEDIELSKSVNPVELGYAPFALALGTPQDWKGTWPDVIHHHISHWTYHETARIYATKDVEYLQRLYDLFESPELGDDDSELSCMVAAVRWRGFSFNKEGITDLRDKTRLRNVKILSPEEAKGIPFLDPAPGKPPGWKKFEIPTSPAASKIYIKQKLSEMEILGFEDSDADLTSSTKRTVLEKLSKMEIDGVPHPAALRAKEVLEARQADYEANFYEKILLAGRFHASSSIIGSLSGRMAGGGSARGIEGGGKAGGDGVNPLGVKRTKEVRGQFDLADGGLKLCGGDFSGFEVCLAAAVYDDPDLIHDLMTGKKIHGLFGQFLFPHLTYDQIVASAGTQEDYYDRSKRGFFAVIYGGNEHTLNDRIGIPIEVASEALKRFGEKYPGVGRHRLKIIEMFCSMRQPGGIGSVVEWHEPHDYIEAGFGFRRYFTLENKICKALFDLASEPPKEWLDIKLKVVRRDRQQTASGAVRSALFGAAFALQAANMRAAANHEIQSYGAQITKRVQRKIWDLQPSGVGEWLVQPLNVHDEIQCPTHPSIVKSVEKVVNETVESIRPRVPLIKMDWSSVLNTWADKS